MKALIQFLLLALLAIVLAACGNKENVRTPPPPIDKSPVTGEKLPVEPVEKIKIDGRLLQKCKRLPRIVVTDPTSKEALEAKKVETGMYVSCAKRHNELVDVVLQFAEAAAETFTPSTSK